MIDALLAGFVTVNEDNYFDIAVLTLDIEVGESIRFYTVGKFVGIDITAIFTPPGIGSVSGLKFYDSTNEDDDEIFIDPSIKTLEEAEGAYKRFTESAVFRAYLPGYNIRRIELEK